MGFKLPHRLSRHSEISVTELTNFDWIASAFIFMMQFEQFGGIETRCWASGFVQNTPAANHRYLKRG